MFSKKPIFGQPQWFLILLLAVLSGWVSFPQAVAGPPAAGGHGVTAAPPAPDPGPRADPSGATPPPLSLETCVQIALDRNPAGRAAREGVLGAEEGIGEAQAPYYPEVGLTLGYSRWERHAFLPSGVSRPGMPGVIGPTDDWFTGLKARYTLFDSGERRAKMRAALAGKGAAAAHAARMRQDIALEVYRSFYSLAAALENLAVAREQLDRAERHLVLSGERKAAGVVPRADVLRAQVEVGNGRMEWVKAEHWVRLSKGDLNTAMGLPVETPVEIEVRPEEIRSPAEIDLSRALRQAVRLRPELKQALHRVEAAAGAVDQAKSAYGPRLRAEGGYGWRDTVLWPQDEDWLVGIVVDLPIFTGFARKHRLAKTKTQLSTEQAEAERTILQIRKEVWAAHSALKESYEAIQAAGVQLADARESMRLSRERYKVGVGTITDLLDAQTALARSEVNLVRSQWEYHNAQAVFRRSVGSLAQE